MLLLVDLLGAHVLKGVLRFLGFQGFLALGEVLDALSGKALLALWGEGKVAEGWSRAGAAVSFHPPVTSSNAQALWGEVLDALS